MASGTFKISEPTFPNGKAWFNGDCDTLKESGYYFIGTASNIPFAWGAMVVIARNDTVVQIAHRDFPSALYYRYWTNSNGWGEWRSDTYYGVGDEINLNGGIYTGFKISSGGQVVIVTPKKIPTGLTISHNLGVGWVRGAGVNSTGTVASVARTTENVLTIAISVTGSSIPDSNAIGVNLTGKITFS